MFHFIKTIRLKVYLLYYHILPVKENKILFWANSFKAYGDSPKYIAEYLIKNFKKKYEIVWVFENGIKVPENMPKEIRVVRYFSVAYLKEISTAKYIICNARTSEAYFFQKRPNQIYIQTWHSSLRLKMIEGDAADLLPDSYLNIAKADSKKIDYILSGCQFSSEIIRRAFWYSGKILECGTPRIDYLLHQSENKDKLYIDLGLNAEYQYALYAPTFRNGDSLDAYNIDMNRLVNNLVNRFGGKWKVLYRLHPNQANRIQLENLPECCINMTNYHDMQELLVLSDILITDYSSSMFDIAYLKKMCILYVSDLDAYTEHERKLYFNVSNLPFIIAKNNDELEEMIRGFDDLDYQTKLEKFMRQIGSFETGNACKQITEIIFNKSGK